MERELSIQVYSIADHMSCEEDVRRSFESLASYGYSGVQTAGAFTFGAERYADAAHSAGLKIIGTHVKMDLLRDTEAAVRLHRTLGTRFAGIGAMPSFIDGDFTPQSISRFIDDANSVAEALSEHGLKFTYHHHSIELCRLGNETVLELLLRELDPQRTSFVLDTYWLQQGGASVTDWICRFAGRVDILHLKDMGVPFGKNDCTMTELGAGNIDFREVLRAADFAGVSHLCYEQDGGHAVDSLESARVSAEYFFSIA